MSSNILAGLVVVVLLISVFSLYLSLNPNSVENENIMEQSKESKETQYVPKVVQKSSDTASLFLYINKGE